MMLQNGHEILPLKEVSASVISPLQNEHRDQLLAVERLAQSGMCPAALGAALEAGSIEVLGVWQKSAEGHKLIGYAVLAIGPFDAELEAIGVLPNWRRYGIARCLLQTLIDMAIEKGSERLLLEVRATNQAAIRLYQKNGFHIDGHRKHYYPAASGATGREDAVLMSRPLNS
ncbi:ribosomal protein S18-alanine N-acetyltransferase [Halomonas sp. LS-001]